MRLCITSLQSRRPSLASRTLLINGGISLLFMAISPVTSQSSSAPAATCEEEPATVELPVQCGQHIRTPYSALTRVRSGPWTPLEAVSRRRVRRRCRACFWLRLRRRGEAWEQSAVPKLGGPGWMWEGKERRTGQRLYAGVCPDLHPLLL
ncbi:hypothetical protein FA95DRAFT_710283 [Auriscalpium vulgare]|uniref:Uncharacterized protein n=1 Tax=Auriscalpium vulgare TaxID=40419 RepID=A0ACB8RCC2_9AGAM|nr:hypothetical protein FA95DRAFT_710283 [Auriscalpium vulgare]